MKKIIWPVGNKKEARYDVRIARELQKKTGVEILFVTDFKAAEPVLEEEGVRYKTLSQLFIEAADEFPADADALIAKANDILGKIDINMVVHGDHIVEMLLSPQNARILVAKTILAFDWLFRQESIDAVIRYAGNNISFWVPSIIGEKYGRPSFILIYAGFFEISAVQNGGIQEQWDWPSFRRAWKKWQNEIVPIEKKKNIDSMVESYIQRHSQAVRSRLTKYVENNQSRGFSARVKNYVQQIRAKFGPALPVTFPNQDEYLQSPDVNQLEAPFENRMKLGRKQWESSYKKFRYDAIPAKYIYMPLNQPYDAPHCCWNPMNYMQEYIAQVVLKSLPVGYELLIKEHPYSCGYPDHGALTRLQESGVKIAHPDIHSLDLIRNAGALFCMGDTSGWEAILLRTPTIVYGSQPFYAAYPLSCSVNDPNQVHYALSKAIRLRPMTAQQEELRYSFIQSVLDSSYHCNIWGYKGLIWTKADNSSQNIERIAGMLEAESQLTFGNAK